MGVQGHGEAPAHLSLAAEWFALDIPGMFPNTHYPLLLLIVPDGTTCTLYAALSL